MREKFIKMQTETRFGHKYSHMRSRAIHHAYKERQTVVRGDAKDKRSVEDEIHLFIRRFRGADHRFQRIGSGGHTILIHCDPDGVLHL